jgi:Fur family zinc uptake transcriptional regulator
MSRTRNPANPPPPPAAPASPAPAESPAKAPLTRAERALIASRLAEAQQLCNDRGTLLTPLRREVLKLLLERGGSAKAYDLHDDMRNAHGRVAPMTVYRALDFLMQMQLVHRVDSLNVFIACSHGETSSPDHQHDALMLVCTRCDKVVEQAAHEVASRLTTELAERFGFVAQGVEIKGLCRECAAKGERASDPSETAHR